MAKGDDYKIKKKNKAFRKKLQRDPAAAVSARVAALIAAKKRRKTGKRRKCEGMCYSLPTPEDPFNEKHGKEDTEERQGQKKSSKRKNDSQRKIVSDTSKKSIDGRDPKRLKAGDLKNHGRDGVNQQNGAMSERVDADHQTVEISGGPSKFFILCLKSIQDALLENGEMNKDQSLFVNPWGIEFWKLYSLGSNILETSGTRPSLQQMAWMVSAAADSISKKENEGESLSSPFLLYLVPSQQCAAKVRSVCKPLKSLGIQTVSLHPGTSVDHQIQGLESCEPEFLVATPERLLELLSLKAIDISGASLLVVDAMDMLCLDAVKRISESISSKGHVIAFEGSTANFKAQDLQTIMRGPARKLSSGESVKSRKNASVLKSTRENASKGS